MFNIKLYIKEHTDFDILYGILKKNNFEVIRASKIGMISKTNEEHLKCAIINNAIILTDDKKFQETPPNIKHKGILIIHKFADQKKEMTPVKIVNALRNIRKQVIERGISLENKVYPLNIFV